MSPLCLDLFASFRPSHAKGHCGQCWLASGMVAIKFTYIAFVERKQLC